mgnify:CR=1
MSFYKRHGAQLSRRGVCQCYMNNVGKIESIHENFANQKIDLVNYKLINQLENACSCSIKAKQSTSPGSWTFQANSLCTIMIFVGSVPTILEYF